MHLHFLFVLTIGFICGHVIAGESNSEKQVKKDTRPRYCSSLSLCLCGGEANVRFPSKF